jgi:hypothetical protein
MRPSSAVVRRNLRKNGEQIEYSLPREFRRGKNDQEMEISSTLDAIEHKMNRANEVYHLNLLSKQIKGSNFFVK